jgi:hypothetical protein
MKERSRDSNDSVNIPLSIDDSLVKDITGKSLSDLIKYGLLKWTTRMLESIQSHLLDNQSVWSKAFQILCIVLSRRKL